MGRDVDHHHNPLTLELLTASISTQCKLKQPQRLWGMRAQSDGWAERLMQATVRKLIASW